MTTAARIARAPHADRSGGGRWAAHLGLVAVICLFCAPLFVGLSGWDLASDEAIYSYAVDRILETGDWLTPRSVPYDGPFLEKPPLKFWIVAAAIRAGVLPHDEFGLRFFDALFGSIAFIYVVLLGRLLAGPICGFVAVLVLFTLDPLIFEHGLRSNNMEAALVLAFCGGVYHFARWVEDDPARRRRMHPTAAAAWFTLGFMTKFVAVLFLPLVCAAAIAWRRNGLRHVRTGWRDWIVPLLFVVAATVPWFVYQGVHSGRDLWETMFEVHVVERFTGALDTRQLQPWNYYYSQLWLELILAGSHWIVAFGAAMLLWKGWKGDPWLARLLCVWWMLPIALISFGTSKLIHYSYPFLPPLALGAGAVAQAVFAAIERRVSTGVAAAARTMGRAVDRRVDAAPIRRLVAQLAVLRSTHIKGWIRPILFVAALFALALALWTAVIGSVRWEVNDVRLLRNSSVFRPLCISLILFYLSGYIQQGSIRTTLNRSLAALAVAIILPVLAYPLKVERALTTRHPLRTLRDCVTSVESSAPPEIDVYLPYDEILNHSYYYYLRHVGPWVEHNRPRPQELRDQLDGNRLLLMTSTDYSTLAREVGTPPAVALSDGDSVNIVPTGRFEVCTAEVVAAGATRVARPRRTGS